MKKAFAVISILAFLLLTACGEKAPQAQSAATLPPENSAAATGEQAVLLASMYGINNTTAATEGTFEWRGRPDQGSNLTYIDYATQSQVYLCNQPNCTHDNGSCPSYFSASSGYLFLSADQQTLFAVESAVQGGSPVDMLWSMQRNGTNRTKVISLASGEMLLDTVAARSNKLYLTVMMPNGAKELREVDVTTGETNVVTKFPASSWVFGAFEDKLILLHLKADRFKYETLSLSTKETEIFYEYSYEDSGFSAVGRCDGDMLYVIQPNESGLSNVIKHNIKTGEETILTSELPFFSVDTTFVKGFYDHHMLVDVTDTTDPQNIKRALYSVALDTGAVTQMQHDIKSGLLQKSTSIIAQTETEFLILGDYETRTFAVYSNDGTPYQAEVEVPTYYLISKSDFWANAQTARPIQNAL